MRFSLMLGFPLWVIMAVVLFGAYWFFFRRARA